ncbi:hypothetical protein D3C76_1619590 [compost metagenome]
MTGHWIDRLDLAAKARQGPGIEQGQFRIAQALMQMLGADQQARVRLAGKMSNLRRSRVQAQRQAGCVPSFEPAIKQVHAIAFAQPRQQPPGARGKSA